VPMILMGDELGRSQNGNNNTYCHDTELNWMNWELLQSNAALFQFAKHCVHFRKAHPVLRNRWHFRNTDYVGCGYADITWHGTHAWSADWSGSSRTLAFMLSGAHAKDGTVADNFIYVAMNMHWEAQWFEIPGLPNDTQWHIFANTGANPSEASWEPGTEPVLDNQQGILLGDRSVVILVGK
jgi:isoamylase